MLDGEIVLLLTNVSPNTDLLSDPPTKIIDSSVNVVMWYKMRASRPLNKALHLNQLVQFWTAASNDDFYLIL